MLKGNEIYIAKTLKNAEADADGIAWEDFERFREKKKRKRIIWIGFAAVLLIGIILSCLSFDQGIKDNLNANKSNAGSNTLSGAVSSNSESEIPVSADKGNQYPETNKGILSSNSSDVKHQVLKSSTKSGEPETKPVIKSAPFTVQINPAPEINSIGIEDFFERHSKLSEIKINLKSDQGIFPGYNDLDAASFPRQSANSFKFIRIQTAAMLNYGSLLISPVAKDFIHKDYGTIRNNSESPKSAWNFRISAGREFRNFDFDFGLGIQALSIGGNYDFIYSEKPITDLGGRIISYDQSTPVNVKFQSTQRYTFMEFPLSFNWYPHRLYKNTGLHIALIPMLLRKIGGEVPNALYLDRTDALNNVNYRAWSSGIELGLKQQIRVAGGLSLELMPFYRNGSGLKHSKNFYKSQYRFLGLQCSLKWNIRE